MKRKISARRRGIYIFSCGWWIMLGGGLGDGFRGVSGEGR